MQLAIDFFERPKCVVPEANTLQGKLLRAMQSGERLTPISALEGYQCFSLSQRIGELKRMGWPIQSRMIEVPSGKRVAEYWL
jgi:hypothetical protein